jgi:hypothetical protein
VSPYERLAELAATELSLVREGRVEELAVAQADRVALMAALPATPPAAARGALQRTRALQAELVAELGAGRDAAGRELSHLRRGRGAVRAYGHVSAASPSADRRG